MHTPRSLAHLAEMADKALFHDLLHDVSPAKFATAVGGAAMVAAPVLAGDGSFVALNIDAGGMAGALGQTVSATSNVIYQHPQGSNFPPAAEAIAEEPDLEYDSYVALGGAPSSFGYTGRAPWMTLGGSQYHGFFGAQGAAIKNNDWSRPLNHIWFAPGIYAPPGSTVYSAANPHSGLQSVFVARLTVPRGSTPAGPSVYVGLQTLESSTLAGYLLTLNGPTQFFPIFANSTPPAEATYRLSAYISAQPTIPGFGDADVYDLFVEAVPAQQASAPAPGPQNNPAPNQQSAEGTQSTNNDGAAGGNGRGASKGSKAAKKQQTPKPPKNRNAGRR